MADDHRPPEYQPGGQNRRGGLAAALALPAVLLSLGVVLAATAGRDPAPTSSATRNTSEKGAQFMPKVEKTDDQWREQLTPEQYYVTRQKGTERPYTGEFWNFKEDGKYKCVCCGAELFTSDTKYDSHCGWPSFYAGSKPENLHEEVDHSHGMIRTEVICKNCGAHLGHVFDDGPQPTGMRYCMNSAALKFEKKDAKEGSDK